MAVSEEGELGFREIVPKCPDKSCTIHEDSGGLDAMKEVYKSQRFPPDDGATFSTFVHLPPPSGLPHGLLIQRM